MFVGCWKFLSLLFPTKMDHSLQKLGSHAVSEWETEARHPRRHKRLMTWGSMPRDALHCLNTGYMWEKNSKPATKRPIRFPPYPGKFTTGTLNMEVDGRWRSFSLGGFWGSMLIFRGVDFSEFRPLQNNMAPNSDGTSDFHRRCWVTEEMQQKTSVSHISTVSLPSRGTINK